MFSKCLHLINPNLYLLNRGGGGGVGLCGPSHYFNVDINKQESLLIIADYDINVEMHSIIFRVPYKLFAAMVGALLANNCCSDVQGVMQQLFEPELFSFNIRNVKVVFVNNPSPELYEHMYACAINCLWLRTQHLHTI